MGERDGKISCPSTKICDYVSSAQRPLSNGVHAMADQLLIGRIPLGHQIVLRCVNGPTDLVHTASASISTWWLLMMFACVVSQKNLYKRGTRSRQARVSAIRSIVMT